VNALVALHASDAALKGLDAAPAVRAGALRALAQMYEPSVVAALVDRLHRANDADTRSALVHTLARMANREAPWKGDWWTTRPAHLGPYFDPTPWEESPRIRSALTETLANASGDEFARLAGDLALNEALPRGAGPLLATLAASRDSLRGRLLDALVGRARLDESAIGIVTQLDARSPQLHAAVAQLLAGESALGAGSLSLARTIALDAALDPTLRSSLLGAIAQTPGQPGLEVAAEVFSRLNPVPGLPPTGTPVGTTTASSTAPTTAATANPMETAWRRFVGDRRRATELDYFITMARSGTPSQRTLAYAVLLQSIRAPRTPAPVREKVAPVIDAGWTDPASTPSLVQAVNLMRLESQYADKLASYAKRSGTR
jgi:hypothetical protein